MKALYTKRSIISKLQKYFFNLFPFLLSALAVLTQFFYERGAGVRRTGKTQRPHIPEKKVDFRGLWMVEGCQTYRYMIK